MVIINFGLMVIAFFTDTPDVVFSGFLHIVLSRSILVTDYVALGGIGGTLLNVSIVGLSTVFMIIRLGLKPCGVHIMAVWLSMGFAFFGKNVFNMIPLTFGVWLYAKYTKVEFPKLYLAALLVATLSPSISEIAFLGILSPIAEIAIGVLIGFCVGFIFPVVSAESLKVHRGFQLYNMGFSGGLIATILATLFINLGVDIIPATYWSTGNNVFFAWLLYSISLAMLLMGLFSGLGTENLKESVITALRNYRKMHSHSGRLVTDYYDMYGKSVYINMAVLCVFGTTVTLVLGAELNGPTIAGILTMMGFGSIGKHFRNVVPIVAGATISAFVNAGDPTAPANILSILFSSGLAPIAGAFGPVWGIIAGFLHVNVANYIGDLNHGLNLYNNGFAGGLVALFLLPIIGIFRRDPTFDSVK
jgi:hypothetical protein